MKQLAVLGVLAACLVIANAAAVDPLDASVKTMEGYAQSVSEKADEVTQVIEHKYDEIIVQPQERVETLVHEIEERKEESEVCVVQQEQQLELIVQDLEATLDVCTQVAYNSGASISIQIITRSVDIGYDTYALVKGVQRCRRYNNSILKNTCYAKQLIKAKSLISKTRRAVKDLNQSVDETIPQIVVDLEKCSVEAEQSALEELDAINRNIDNCITLKKVKAKVLN